MTLVFLWVLLAAAGSVAWERDRGTWTLLHTAAKGKGHTLGAKWAVNAVLAVAVTLLVRGAQLGAVWFQAGLSGSGQPAASLEELALCPYPMTVGQFALLTLCLQGLAAALLATLFTALSAVSQSSLAAYGAGALLLGLLLLPVYAVPRSPWLWGPLSLGAPAGYFNAYVTADLLGFPVLWAGLQAVAWAVLAALLLTGAGFVSVRKRRAVA